jgi:hypothetical protein
MTRPLQVQLMTQLLFVRIVAGFARNLNSRHGTRYGADREPGNAGIGVRPVQRALDAIANQPAHEHAGGAAQHGRGNSAAGW